MGVPVTVRSRSATAAAVPEAVGQLGCGIVILLGVSSPARRHARNSVVPAVVHRLMRTGMGGFWAQPESYSSKAVIVAAGRTCGS